MRAPVRPDARTAPEGGEETLSELPVHKTVGDRVAAGTDVGQEMHEIHGYRGNPREDARLVKDVPRLKNVSRCPAHKKLDHYHE